MLDAIATRDDLDVPTHVSMEDYLAVYSEHHYEWVEGELVFNMSSHERHDVLFQFLLDWLRAFLALRPMGELRVHPFIIRFPQGRKFREPDLMLILTGNRDRLQPTYMDGAPDVVIEIVSDESQDRDYHIKKAEYESLGVPEYWIIDPLQNQALFYRLTSAGVYEAIPSPDVYQTPLLPDFQLPLAMLWADTLPNFFDIADQMREILASK